MTRKPDKLMWGKLFDIQLDDGRPLQSQIRIAVVDAILTGTLPPGTPAPSSRELAKEIGVSRNTIILAYQQLVDDGFLISLERSGFTVAPREGLSGRGLTAQHQESRRDGLDWQHRFKIHSSSFRSIVKPSNWQSYRFPFLYGQFDSDLFPIAEWRQCCRQALSVMEIKDWAPDKIDEDDPSLIEQLRTRILPRRGIWAQPSEIMVTLGAQQALYLLAELLFNEDTIVGIENPGYPDMRNIASLRSDKVSPLPIDDDGMVPGAELAACDYAYVTPSHQCPTTVTMSLPRRRALLERAAAGGTILIEDDYESEIRFAGTPLPALKSLDTDGRVIYVSSLSKVLAPGLRLGFIVGPADLIREARALRRLMVRHPPVNNQRAAALFLSFGHYESLAKRLAQVLSGRSETLREALRRHLPEFRVAPGAGGSSLWLSGPEHFDAERAAERAREEGLLFEPGSVFFSRAEDGLSYFRLGYSSVAADRIEAGIALLAQCAKITAGVAGQAEHRNWL